MNECSENKEDNIKKDEEKHICNYTYISSSEGSYNVCRECGNIILLFGKSY